MDSSRKKQRILIVSRILLLGFGMSLIFNFLLGGFLQKGYPYDTFFFRPEAKFLDFYHVYILAADPYTKIAESLNHSDQPWQLPEIIAGRDVEQNHLGPVYFPFAYWVIYPFQLLEFGTGLLTFWITAVIIFAATCLKHVRETAGLAQTLILCVLSYPLLFLLNRSNFEIFMFLFVYLFVYWYDNRPWLSSAALACAISMKFLPVGFAIMYFKERKFKQLVFTGALALLLNVIAYALYPGGLLRNIRFHLFNLNVSSLFYGLDGRDVMFNSNFTSAIKYVLFLLWPTPDLEAASLESAQVLYWVIPAVAVLVLAYCFFFETARWKQVALITCLILLLPSSSADYRLILMYIPFFFWLDSSTEHRFDTQYAILFASLFVPKSYFHLPALPEISISVLLNPLLLFALMAFIMREKVLDRLASPGSSVAVWSHMPKWQKYTISAFTGVLLLWTITSTAKVNIAEDAPVNVIRELNQRAESSYQAGDFRDSIGYYIQWMIREPEDPEPRLGLAQAYLKVHQYWDSYQQYKKAAWLSTRGTDARNRADIGIETTLQIVVCDLRRTGKHKWAEVIQDESQEQFPYLPIKRDFDCWSPLRK